MNNKLDGPQVTEAHRKLASKILWECPGVNGISQLIADSEATAVAEWQESVYLKGEAIDSLLIECDRLHAEIKSCGELSCDECNARTAALIAERDQLRAIFPQICEALGNGSCCAPDISLDFLQSIPNEVAGVVAKLRAEVERLKKQIKDDNRSYGCELRDPHGTIWEQATKDHDRAGKAERALAELREWQAGVIANERLHHAERKDAIARAEKTEAEVIALKAQRGQSDYYAAALSAEAELATERARLDWLTMNAHVEPEEYRGGSCSEGGTLWYSWRFSSPRHAGHHASAAIDAAMKEDTK